MRDWNCYMTYTMLYPILWFVAYLWGIETGWSNQRSDSGGKFVAYLWGIETFAALKLLA